jgi:hypothetical protein
LVPAAIDAEITTCTTALSATATHRSCSGDLWEASPLPPSDVFALGVV